MDIKLLDNMYPVGMWTNGINIWLVGSAVLSRGNYLTGKIYCYNLATKQRVSGRDITFSGRGRRYGIMVRNNIMQVGFSREASGRNIDVVNLESYKL